MNVLTFVTLALATWRVSSLLAEEEGPFGVFVKLRHVMGEYYDEYSEVQIGPKGDKWYHALLYEALDQLTCLWCCTIWVGVVWFLAWLLWPCTTFYVSVPFALSTVAVYINARGVRNRKRTSL